MDSITKFDDFLNNASEFEDLMKVREYRHMAYKQWLSVVKEIESLRQQLAERDALIAKKDDALKGLIDDLILRADKLHQEDAQGVVACGNGVWIKANEALALKPKELG